MLLKIILAKLLVLRCFYFESMDLAVSLSAFYPCAGLFFFIYLLKGIIKFKLYVIEGRKNCSREEEEFGLD